MKTEAQISEVETAMKHEFIGGLNLLAEIADPETWRWLDRIEVEKDERGKARLIPVWIA